LRGPALAKAVDGRKDVHALPISCLLSPRVPGTLHAARAANLARRSGEGHMKRTRKRRRAVLGPQELREVGRDVSAQFERRVAAPPREHLRHAPRRNTTAALVAEIERLRAWLEQIARRPEDARAQARAALRGKFLST
jgi:hypothetical protein